MSDLSRCLVYGAYGYTGELIARLAASRGQRPILAGRSREPLERLAGELGLRARVVGLDDPAALDAALADVDVVLHCAGPFSRTARPMVDACLRTKRHYLDITGEVAVFEACASRSAEAAAAGVMLMPGTGFDVVPSDCLALHLKSRLPTATHLRLAFAGIGGQSSHGTATTVVEGLGLPNLVRRAGELVPVRAGALASKIDFGRGPVPALGIPWGDVSTAWTSTRIPNIEVYTAVPSAAVLGAKVSGFLPMPAFVKRALQRRIDSGPKGPSDAQRAKAFSVLVGEARDGTTTVCARLRTAEGYTLTADASLAIAARVLERDFVAGHRTPAQQYGADFVLRFEKSEREDLARSPFAS